jgi:putative ABC transport system ATP-binding protein
MSKAAGAALFAQALTKAFGCGPTRVEALRGLDLDIAPGEFVAVMGASGSGKSTLLHLLAGLEPPTSGIVRVGGIDLTLLTDDERALMRRTRVGMIFQAFNLLGAYTAEENIALPLAIAGYPAAEARRRARRGLERVGLCGRGHHRPGELSGGEQQRVAIARALAIQPCALLADEPTGNLDSDSGARVLALLRQLADEERQTILLVTHDTAQARQADRLLVLRDGRITERSRREVA